MGIIEALHETGFSQTETASGVVLTRDDAPHAASTMTFHAVMPGVSFVINAFNTRDAVSIEYDKDVHGTIEINHCRHGRFGTILQGRQFYLGEGEMEANLVGIKRESPEFPLGFYQGLELLIEPKPACTFLEPIFPEAATQIKALEMRLKNFGEFVSIAVSPQVNHILGELYQVSPGIESSLLRCKVIELLLVMETASPTIAPARRYFQSRDYAAVRAACDEITSHLDKRFTVEDFVEKFGVGRTTFLACFSEVYGMPYYSFVKRYKMHNAAHLLEETDLSVAEIGLRMGYSNPSKFSAAFRTATGTTPLAYRKENERMEHLELFGAEIK